MPDFRALAPQEEQPLVVSRPGSEHDGSHASCKRARLISRNDIDDAAWSLLGGSKTYKIASTAAIAPTTRLVPHHSFTVYGKSVLVGEWLNADFSDKEVRLVQEGRCVLQLQYSTCWIEPPQSVAHQQKRHLASEHELLHRLSTRVFLKADPAQQRLHARLFVTAQGSKTWFLNGGMPYFRA